MARIARDVSLEGLAHLLNTVPLSSTGLEQDAQHWPRRAAHYAAFMHWLSPWLLGAPSHELPPSPEQTFPPFDCSNTRFAEVLTGRPRRKPRRIVDFVPYGYDPDMLEVRLLESWPRPACSKWATGRRVSAAKASRRRSMRECTWT